MCKALRGDAAGRHLLQAVVADRCGGPQAFVCVTGIELDFAGRCPSLLRGFVAPHPGEAVGLQFESDRCALGARTWIGPYAIAVPEQVLHVMTELVRDHVGLREIAGRSEAAR